MELDSLDFNYLGLCLEAFFFGAIFFFILQVLRPPSLFRSTGIYSAIFIMYIQYHSSERRSDMRKTILFFAICALYILSSVTMILDFAGVEILLVRRPFPKNLLRY